MHNLPSTGNLQTLLPFASERMRKRRCFADKDLDMAMYEREKSFEETVLKAGTFLPHSGLVGAPAVTLLHRYFPMLDERLTQYVYNCCGQNLNAAAMQLHRYQTGLMLRQTAESQNQPAQTTAGNLLETPADSPGHLAESVRHDAEDDDGGHHSPAGVNESRSGVDESRRVDDVVNCPSAYMAYCISRAPAMTSLGAPVWYSSLMTPQQQQHHQQQQHQQLSYVVAAAHQSTSASLTNHRRVNRAQLEATCEDERCSPASTSQHGSPQGGAVEQLCALSKHQIHVDDKPKHCLKFSVEALIGKC